MPTDYRNKDSWLQICSMTLNNYIFMEKRLSANKKVSDFVLTYYSIFLVFNSITAFFFKWYNNHLSNYFGIMLSIVLLAYSLINSNANYVKRIDTITEAINNLKTIKRKLTDENLEAFQKEYNEIVDKVEFRSDIDFFRTVKCLCKEHGINWYQKPSKIKPGNEVEQKIKNYLSELSPRTLQLKIVIRKAFDILLFVFPIVVVLFCVV